MATRLADLGGTGASEGAAELDEVLAAAGIGMVWVVIRCGCAVIGCEAGDRALAKT